MWTAPTGRTRAGFRVFARPQDARNVANLQSASMLQQRTIKGMTRAVGVGLHSGQKVEMTLRPAAPDSGIVFRRVDLPHPVEIPVDTMAVSDTRMASTISPGGDPGGPKVQ